MILNIEQARHNIKRYRSITNEEVTCHTISLAINFDDFVDRIKLLNELTGLCYCSTCRMCKAVNNTCTACVWSMRKSYENETSPCIDENYYILETARTPEEVAQGYHDRADILEILIAKAEESNERENIITTIT